jgi:hypothetical protein
MLVHDLVWFRESGVLDKHLGVLEQRGVDHSFDGDFRLNVAGNIYVFGERRKPRMDTNPLGYVVDEKVVKAAVRRFHADD